MLLLPVIFLFSCKKKSEVNIPENALFKLMPAAQTGISFNNKVTDNNDFNVFNYRNFYNGGGVAIGDVNNDGRPDIYFSANQGSNKLYLNEGNWKFDDVTEKAGVKGAHRWHTGVSMVDINGDGWLDIYVCNSGGMQGASTANELYINQKNGTFKEEAEKYGLNDAGLSTQAIFFDMDHDGDLDCFVLNNSYRPIGSFGYDRNLRNVRDAKNGDRLYRNDGGKFTDVSAKAGIYGSEIGFGLGIAAGDINNNGWDDLYVSNDFFEHDYLYLNKHNGTFKDNSNQAVQHMSMSSMGSDMADINNDGLLDIFTTDMLPENDYRLKTTTKFDEYDVYNAKLQNDFGHQFTSNALQLNNGDGTFSDIAALAGVNATDWSWGALCFDFNNDGWKDVYVSNGITKDLTNQDFLAYFSSEAAMKQARDGGFNMKAFLDKMPSTKITNYGFLNQKNLQFENETTALGLGTPTFSNGAAYGDLDGDGDLDLVVNNENGTAFMYRNRTSETNKSHFLKVKLQGEGLNTFGIGTKVILYAKNSMQVIEQMPVRGFESSVEPVLNFGLGTVNQIDSVHVIWPDLKMQLLKNVSTNQTINLKQTDAKLTFHSQQTPSKTFYQNNTAKVITGDIYHKENDFKDFDQQRLIPKMLSTEGPKLAVADVNGDGLQDFFMGGAINDTAKLFIQQPNGTYLQKRQFAFEQDRLSEDVGALFFDADHDGDMDLAVVSGGNQEKEGSLNLLSRLYINDGKGNFVRKFKGWPLVSINASCISLNPDNGDLFIGGRSVPGAYGVIPSSKLLRNDGRGNFTDVTASLAPELQKLGMVTDAQWVDLDNSGEKSLVIVGDWMPVTILKYKNNQLKKASEIAGSAGWWNCLTVADLNGDGKPDLIAGNNGINSKIKADKNSLAKMYVSDFDNNGQVECIPVYYKTDGKAYPFNLHDDLIRQLPILKKKILRYDAYAGKGIEDIFTSDQLEKATVFKVEQSQTCVFFNLGNGKFDMEPLPIRTQFAPVYSILYADINQDGIKDLVFGGNFYGLKPEVGRYDASYGVTLLGDANHHFNFSPPAKTGLMFRGEIRDIREVKTKNGNDIVVARNNDALQIFEPVKK